MSVTPNSIVTPQALAASAVTFVNADGTTQKTLATAGANGSIVVGISVASTDASTRNIQLFAYDGSTSYLIGSVLCPGSSGSDGSTPAISLVGALIPFAKLDASGNSTLQIPSGWSLKVAPQAAVTAAKTITIVCFREDL